MIDPAREKFRRLMAEIADLEGRLADLEQDREAMTGSPDPRDAQVLTREVNDLREELAARRVELARLSDGCGKPHPQG